MVAFLTQLNKDIRRKKNKKREKMSKAVFMNQIKILLMIVITKIIKLKKIRTIIRNYMKTEMKRRRKRRRRMNRKLHFH